MLGLVGVFSGLHLKLQLSVPFPLLLDGLSGESGRPHWKIPGMEVSRDSFLCFRAARGHTLATALLLHLASHLWTPAPGSRLGVGSPCQSTEAVKEQAGG